MHTVINSGETFQYNLAFPLDEPPGVYWYHPHAHGLTEAALQGGASGAIVVDGIQRFHPEVSGLRHRVLMIDGVPVNSRDGQANNGNSTSKLLDSTHVLVPTAARAEFIVSAPPAGIFQSAYGPRFTMQDTITLLF